MAIRRILTPVAVATLASAAALIAAPAQASGARIWYTNPHGAGQKCSSVDPCGLAMAMSMAQSGDSIVMASGSYGSASKPLIAPLQLKNTGVTMRDATPSKRPTIFSNAAVGVGLSKTSTIDGIVIYYTGIKLGISVPNLASARQVKVIDSSVGTACGVLGTLSDSLCVNTAAGGVAAGSGGIGATVAPALIGDTLEATGSASTGVRYTGTGGATASVSITNTIAHGTTTDVDAATSDNTATVTISTNHSDLASTTAGGVSGTATVTTNGTDISAPPRFVNRASGNFHELPGSPTVNAGVKIVNSVKSTPPDTDLDGLSRLIGGRPDIGAYELRAAPAIGKLRKSTITKKAATVLTTVNPEGLATKIHFVAKHGSHQISSHPKSIGAGVTAVGVSAKVGGLKSATKYRIYIVATNSAGRSTSAALKVTTH